MRSVVDLLVLRWRAAQVLLARRDGDDAQAALLLAKVMPVEDIDYADLADELDLLAAQFSHRARWCLAAEVDRVGRKLMAVTA